MSKKRIDALMHRDLPSLGKAGEMVQVRPGFLKNFLHPKGYASRAAEYSARALQHAQEQYREKDKEARAIAEKLASSLDGQIFYFAENVNQFNALYGSIRPSDISRALKNIQFPVDPEMIEPKIPIKETGVFSRKVYFHHQAFSVIYVSVARSTEEAREQARVWRIERGGVAMDDEDLIEGITSIVRREIKPVIDSLTDNHGNIVSVAENFSGMQRDISQLKSDMSYVKSRLDLLCDNAGIPKPEV